MSNAAAFLKGACAREVDRGKKAKMTPGEGIIVFLHPPSYLIYTSHHPPPATMDAIPKVTNAIATASMVALAMPPPSQLAPPSVPTSAAVNP